MLVKSAKLFIDDGGAGNAPVIFLHSLAGNTAHWSAQLNFVRQTQRAIAIDMRGHGQSITNAVEVFTTEMLVDDIDTIVTELGIEKFVLVGHSMGGALAAAYAGQYPEKVAGLLLVDPPGDSTQIPAEQVHQFIGIMESDGYANFVDEYWQQILTGATEATRTTVLQNLHETPKATVVGISKALFQYNPAQAFDSYAGPTLIVTIPATETPFSLHKLLPDLPSKTVTETSHWLHMDKPDLFNEILDNFLQSTNI